MVAVLAFPVIFFASYGLVALVDDYEMTVASAAVFLLPVVAYGAVVARAWTLAMPSLWAVLILGVWRIVDLVSGTCSVCTGEDDWLSISALVLYIGVIPLTLAVALGAFIGITFRDRRDRRDATRSASASAGSA